MMHENDWTVIDRYVQGRMRSARIPGFALAIVKDDQIVFLKGYGRADSSGRPVTPLTPFIIGSITKSFTALAVMQLVEAGQVELEAPVQRYLPWFRVADPQASAQITVRQLLHQTSGLPQLYETQVWTAQDKDVLERSVRFLQTKALHAPPGQSFAYSNANYAILGLIVQAVSGLTYEDYVREQIFAPLDMQHSFADLAAAQRDGMASGHRWWFGVPVPFNPPHNRAELPAGYLISSAEDMAHFLIANLNGGRYGGRSLLSPEGIALMHTEPAPGAYAFGWEVVQDQGRALINHDGGASNFQASIFFDPERRVGVFVAANVINALDAFSSPRGSSPLDGPTARGIAHSVLNLATHRPLPPQGPGNLRLTLIFNLVIAALSAALGLWLRRIPGRYQRIAQRGIADWPELLWRSGLAAGIHFTGPVGLLYLALKVPAWKVISQFQPDLAVWLQGASLVVFLKGVLEIVLLGRVFRKKRNLPAKAGWRERKEVIP